MGDTLASFKGLPPTARYGILGFVTVGGYLFYKKWQAAKAGSSGTAPTLTVSGATAPLNTDPGSNNGPGSSGGTGGNGGGVRQTMSQLLGFLSPNVPVVMSNNQLIDAVTGRPAYYGPYGQPGGPVQAGLPVPAGAAQWIEPGGKQTWYIPNSYTYGDPNRTPVAPWTVTPPANNWVAY